MRFDLDETVVPVDHALHGLVPLATIAGLEERWKAAKIDEWCAVAGLNTTAAALRDAVGLPAAAPIEYVITEATRKAAGDARVHRALAGYQQAATVYEGVRVHLADLRNRATIPTA